MSAIWEAHFDELAELGEIERGRRLEEIEGADPDLARHLKKLLAADSGEHGELTEPLVARAPGFVAGALAEAGPVPERERESGRAGERIGNYRLLSLLGRGGMAEVWLAERADGEFDSRVALKLVRPDLGSEAIVAGFLRERRILARLAHPGIARLLDGGRSQSGEPYFVLEHIEGTPITGWCAGHGLSLEERLRLMIEVCEAVDHAHRSLVVHRDLKPSNVLVDSSGRPKLLDFGIAKLLSPETGRANPWESGALRLGGRAFTPGYAAPEQISGEPVTTATDVYALGVLLYELLAGEKPFPRSSRSLPDLMDELTAETFEPPSARLRRLAGKRRSWPRNRAVRLEGDLDAIVAKALAREPELRYSGAAALADDLRRFLARRPVRARPAGFVYRASRCVARHRLGVAAAALAIGSLLGGLTVALWQASVARAEARSAERARGYLVSLFEALEPEQARSEPVTPRKLLAAGVRRLDRELADEPAFHAEMLDLQANLHRKLGLLSEGRALAQRALALRLQLYGRSSAEAAESLITLGWIRLDQGEPLAARGLLERGIAILERTEGPGSLAVADAREPLVEALFVGESAEPALPVAEQRLATYRCILGDDHEKTGLTWNDRGVLLLALGRYDDAEADYRRSLAVLGVRLAADDPRLAYPHHNLGDLLYRRGRLAEAERELQSAYDLRRRSLGKRHPETALSLAALGQVLLSRRQYGPAEAAFRQVLKILGDSDQFTAASARLLLARTLYEHSRLEEALPELDRGIADLQEIVGSDHPLLLGARGVRAQLRLDLGQKREVLEELHDILARLAAIGQAGDELRAELLATLGDVKRSEGQIAEALELHRQVRQLNVQFYGEEHAHVAATDFAIALDLLADPAPETRAARRAEALPLLLRARDRMRRLDPSHSDLPRIESQLAGLRKTLTP